MKIFLIFNGRFPSEKAASLFAAKSVEYFSKWGIDTILLVPKRLKKINQKPRDYYNLEKDIDVIHIPIIDFLYFGIFNKLSFYLNYISFSIGVFFYLLFKAKKNDVVFSNEFLPLVISSFYFKNVFYEMHDFPESKLWLFGKMVQRFKWILIHNHWKTKKFLKKFDFNKKRIITIPNAVEIEKFNIDLSKDQARERLGIPANRKIVIYTGHLYSWKGIDTLIKTSKLLPEVFFYIIGGTEKDINKYKKITFDQENILYIGFRPHSEIPIWQKAGECLIIPNTAKEDISKYYTSPMKLFEYMASGRPIVASDIPSIREIVNEEDVILVQPDSPESLMIGIKEAIFGNTNNKVESSKKKVKKYTWKKRQQKIIDFIQN